MIEMHAWSAWMEVPQNFVIPQNPTLRSTFMRSMMRSRQVPQWRATLVRRLGWTPADAAAVPHRTVAFRHLVEARPF